MKPTHVPPGTRFNSLTIIEEVERIRYGVAQQSFRAFSCQCDCGNVVTAALGSLKRGNTRSCGCLHEMVSTAKRHLVEPGQTYGRLTVINEAPRASHRKRRVNCRCQCGEVRTIDLVRLQSGDARSCGCIWRERAGEHSRTHGLSKHPLYRIWTGMHDRCRRVTNKSYPHYGGRGIVVCERWSGRDGFPNFLSDMGDRPDVPEDATRGRRTYSLDRIDNDGPYSPENCRWATQSEQMFNQGQGRL